MMQLSRIVIRSQRVLNGCFPHQQITHSKEFLASPLTSSHILNRSYSTNDNDVELASNPFFEKYKEKIKHMQSTNPAEYDERMKEIAKRLYPNKTDKSSKTGEKETSDPVNITPPSESASSGVGMTRAKTLDSVMKMDLIEDKSPEEISKIWNQYHIDKDCIFAVIKDHEYQNLREKSKECPVFVFPVKRNDGFEMILTQFDRNDVYFTPLAMFQLVKEDSPPCLTLNHFTELMDNKGIVLMQGQYDDKVLSHQSALSLVQQMSIFYGKNSKFYPLVQKFNHKPETFDYNELIESFKTLPQYDMQ